MFLTYFGHKNQIEQDMIEIKKIILKLFDKALVNPRLRQNYDFHISSDDGSQRMLSIFMPGTDIPIHRHPMSNENVLLICGKLIGVLFDDNGNEVERIHFDPSAGNFGGGELLEFGIL